METPNQMDTTNLDDQTPLFRATKRRKTAYTRLRNELLPATETASAATTSIDGSQHDQPGTTVVSSNESADPEDNTSSVSNIVRARRMKSRGTGIAFSDQTNRPTEHTELPLVVANAEPGSAATGVPLDMASRFTRGMDGRAIQNVDENSAQMMAYIETEMARRHGLSQKQKPEPTLHQRATRVRPASTEVIITKENSPTSPPKRVSHDGLNASKPDSEPMDHGNDHNRADDDEDVSNSSEKASPGNGPKPNQATTTASTITLTKPSHASSTPINQISEVDLGTLAHETNRVRTSAAMQGTQNLPTSKSEQRRRQRPRLGRDGKLFTPKTRPRQRKVPDQEALARDSLVEKVLSEHALAQFDIIKGGSMTAGPDGHSAGADQSTTTRGANLPSGKNLGQAEGQATDEALALQFQTEFLDQMAERQARHRSKASNAQSKATGSTSAAVGGPGAAENTSKGPKLGGSRAARARMVAAMQAQQGQGQGQGSGHGHGQAQGPGRK